MAFLAQTSRASTGFTGSAADKPRLYGLDGFGRRQAAPLRALPVWARINGVSTGGLRRYDLFEREIESSG
jgi:hypothetical protein